MKSKNPFGLTSFYGILYLLLFIFLTTRGSKGEDFAFGVLLYPTDRLLALVETLVGDDELQQWRQRWPFVAITLGAILLVLNCYLCGFLLATIHRLTVKVFRTTWRRMRKSPAASQPET